MSAIALPVLSEPRAEIDPAERARIADELRRLHVGVVRFDEHDRLLYSTDASLYQVTPIGVVIPTDSAAVTARRERSRCCRAVGAPAWRGNAPGVRS
jgi:hypothetical protein